MTRRAVAVATVGLALVLGAACGKYGKPVRHRAPVAPAPADAGEPSGAQREPEPPAAEPAP